MTQGFEFKTHIHHAHILSALFFELATLISNDSQFLSHCGQNRPASFWLMCQLICNQTLEESQTRACCTPRHLRCYCSTLSYSYYWHLQPPFAQSESIAARSWIYTGIFASPGSRAPYLSASAPSTASQSGFATRSAASCCGLFACGNQAAR